MAKGELFEQYARRPDKRLPWDAQEVVVEGPKTPTPGVVQYAVKSDSNSQWTWGFVTAQEGRWRVGHLQFRFERGGEAEVQNLQVHQQYQRQGVGSKLYRIMEQQARTAGCNKVTGTVGFNKVDTAVPAAFWRDQGFQISGSDMEKRL